MEAKKFKRSFWRVVNPEVEIKYTLVVAWLIILAFLISGLVTYLTFWNNLLLLPDFTHPEYLLIFQKKTLKILGVLFLFGGLPIVVLGAILQFRILHRVSGPLYRMEKVVQEAAVSGKLPKAPIILREKDFYNGLAKAFNQLVDKIRSGAKFE
jgi:methyl-accepting chemotaxis protein